MRFAFADPPYPGQARRHYSHDPLCAEVDHAELIDRLAGYDGWALCTSSPALRDLLALCPADVRVMPWVKPFASFKPGVNPAFAWEPVIFHGGRPLGRDVPTVRDWHSAPITLKRGLAGVKPDSFNLWVLDVLNVQPGDTLGDLYPGSGGMGRAFSARIRGLSAQAPPLLFDLTNGASA